MSAPARPPRRPASQADEPRPPSTGRRRVDTWSRWGLVALLGTAGVAHFVAPDPFASIVPPALGDPLPWVWASGVAEVGSAGLLASDRTRRLGGWAAVVTFLAVYPANVYMAVAGGLGAPAWLAWARLPLQIPLIWAAWRQTRA